MDSVISNSIVNRVRLFCFWIALRATYAPSRDYVLSEERLFLTRVARWAPGIAVLPSGHRASRFCLSGKVRRAFCFSSGATTSSRVSAFPAHLTRATRVYRLALY